MGAAIHYGILGLGALNLTLVFFQLASGRRWLKVPMTVHRKTGIALAVSASLHGFIALALH